MLANFAFTMDASEDKSTQLCSSCAKLDLDAIFGTAEFNSLIPLNSTPNIIPWTKYIRKVATFTEESLRASSPYCRLCTFLRALAPSVIGPVPPAIPLGHMGSQPNDEEGYALIAFPSDALLSVSTANTRKVSREAPREEGPMPSLYPPKTSATWLGLIRGQNALENRARVLEERGYENIPGVLVRLITIYVKNAGTWIAELTPQIYRDHEITPIRGRWVHSEKINFKQIRQWLNFCDTRHGSCVPGSKKAVPRMKLIDCERRRLVTAEPYMRYVALSYVWGTTPLEDYVYPNLPGNLPATVEDAIMVTRKLGVRFIWVDRYCIWQGDAVHKKSQVMQMPQIYNQAVATIAASCGVDPSYGLPGVSSRRRISDSQLCGYVGRRAFMSGRIQTRHVEEIDMSAWDTRAWTFQEAILSSRVLFFTNYEVSLLCSEAECFEHLTHPTKVVDFVGERRFRYLTALNAPSGVATLISIYSQRKMTLSSDALNAVLGVLTAWTKINKHCFHYWGIPLLFPAGPEECTEGVLVMTLWAGLGWILQQSTFRAGSRREGFPTWSWLAISGRCSARWEVSRTGHDKANYRCAVPNEKGEPISWSDFVRSGCLSWDPDLWGRHLQLEAWIFSLGPFQQAAKSERKGPAFYLPLIKEAKDTGRHPTALEFIPDFGLASPESFLTSQFSAVTAYLDGYAYDSFAIVYERSGTDASSGRRIGILRLQVSNVEDDIMSPVFPSRKVDIKSVFDARWGTVQLE